MTEHATAEPAREPPAAEPSTSGGLPQIGGQAHAVLRLQRLLGNQAVVRYLQRIEQISGNPADLQNPAGQQTTQHGRVGINEAVDRPDAAPAAVEPGQRFVKVVATETAPVDIPVESSPNPDVVYQEQQSAASGFTEVQGLHGTILEPQVEQEADNSLYINGQPQPGDIEQYGIGDCYGLSTIISIASRDPGKIQSMMAADGSGGASVTFQKRVALPGAPATGQLASNQVKYEPVAVHATGELAFELATPGVTGPGAAAPGPRGGGQLHGAQLRAGQRAQAWKYWARIAGFTLEVHRKDTYQMARWAPVLEKAWSRFAEVHGQYGQEGRGGSEKSATAGVGTQRSSGYEAIEGGWSNRVMTAFYGADAEPGGAGGVQQVATTYTPGSNLVLQNQPVVDQLLLLQGRGEGARAQDTDAPIITATAMNRPLVTRLGQAITAAQADPDYRHIQARTRGRIQRVATAVTAYQTAVNATYATTAAANAAVSAALTAVADACVRAVRPGETWSVLQRPNRSAAIQEMVELMLDLRNAGTDNSVGQRNIYGDHVYSVRGFNVALTGGEAVPSPIPTGADRVAFYNKIDPVGSTVRVQNPHHGNEPDPTGEGKPVNQADGAPSGASSDGVFTFTLDQFLRNFTSVESGTFRRS